MRCSVCPRLQRAKHVRRHRILPKQQLGRQARRSVLPHRTHSRALSEGAEVKVNGENFRVRMLVQAFSMFSKLQLARVIDSPWSWIVIFEYYLLFLLFYFVIERRDPIRYLEFPLQFQLNAFVASINISAVMVLYYFKRSNCVYTRVYCTLCDPNVCLVIPAQRWWSPSRRLSMLSSWNCTNCKWFYSISSRLKQCRIILLLQPIT